MLQPTYYILSQDQPTNELNCTLSIYIQDSITYSDEVHVGSCPIIIRLMEQLPENLSMKLYKCINGKSYIISPCKKIENTTESTYSNWQLLYNKVGNIYSCKILLEEALHSSSVIQLNRTKSSLYKSKHNLVVILPTIYTAILTASLILLFISRIRSTAPHKKKPKTQVVDKESNLVCKKDLPHYIDQDIHQLEEFCEQTSVAGIGASYVVTLSADYISSSYDDPFLGFNVASDILLSDMQVRSHEPFVSNISSDSEYSLHKNILHNSDANILDSSDDINTASTTDSSMLESLKETELRPVDTPTVYIISEEGTGKAMDKNSTDKHRFPFDDEIAPIDDYHMDCKSSSFTDKSSSPQYGTITSNALPTSHWEILAPSLDVKLTAGTKKMTVDMKERAKVFEPALRRSFDGSNAHS